MSIIDQFAAMGSALIPIAGAIGGAVKGSKFVQEGQRGLKLRFGKVIRTRLGAPKIVNPGFIFVIPAIEHLHWTHVRTRTLNLPSQEIMLKDKLVFNVSGLLQVQVIDSAEAVYAVLFEVNGFNDTIVDYAAGVLRDVVAEQTYETASDRETIAETVSNRIREQLAEWGGLLIDFRLTDCAPTAESGRAILLSVQTRMRAEALSAAAKQLSGDVGVQALHPTVSAALVGTPVVTALDGAREVGEI